MVSRQTSQQPTQAQRSGLHHLHGLYLYHSISICEHRLGMTTLKPPTVGATLQEWRELGTTGSTDGEYGEDEAMCKRRTLLADFAWLVDHWGIDDSGVRKLVEGSIDTGGGVGRIVDKLREHAPATIRVLEQMDLIHAALQSSCATGDARRRREIQARMVVSLQDRGFTVNPGDLASVKELRSELTAAHEVLKAQQAAEAKRKEDEARMVHPGKLVTHQADLEGLDSRDLRHIDEYYELWSCCGRPPRSVGCTHPPDAAEDPQKVLGAPAHLTEAEREPVAPEGQGCRVI